jgi:hypothetical protein
MNLPDQYNLVCIILAAAFISGCSPKISNTEKVRSQQVSKLNIKLIGENDTVPVNARLIKKVEIGTSMFCDKCDGANLNNAAILQAHNAGGNLVQITNVNPPDDPNPYYSIDANIYLVGTADSSRNVKTYKRIRHIVLDQPLNSFGEVIGGMGFGFSLEYERKLTGKYSGFGVRAGIGMADLDISFTSFPFQVNYLLGNDGFYLELGIGITAVRNNQSHIDSNYSFNYIKVPTARPMSYYGTGYIGYRGPLKGRYYIGGWRFGFTPYFGYHQVSVYFALGLECPL